jgi:hypothetical protein
MKATALIVKGETKPRFSSEHEKFSPSSVVRAAQSLIGAFDLDPNRVLELVLEACELAPPEHASAFMELFSLFRAENVAQVLGFAFQNHAAEAAREKEAARAAAAAAAAARRRRAARAARRGGAARDFERRRLRRRSFAVVVFRRAGGRRGGGWRSRGGRAAARVGRGGGDRRVEGGGGGGGARGNPRVSVSAGGVSGEGGRRRRGRRVRAPLTFGR